MFFIIASHRRLHDFQPCVKLASVTDAAAVVVVDVGDGISQKSGDGFKFLLIFGEGGVDDVAVELIDAAFAVLDEDTAVDDIADIAADAFLALVDDLNRVLEINRLVRLKQTPVTRLIGVDPVHLLQTGFDERVQVRVFAAELFKADTCLLGVEAVLRVV